MGLIPNLIICISLLFISLSAFSLEESDSKVYIVHLESPDIVDSEELESWYHSLLSSDHEVISSSYRDSRILHTYKHVITGFAAWLSAADVKVLEKHDRFLHARPERVFPLHTTHSPNFLGLNTNMGLWKNTNYGEGVIIGVVDSGILPDHPSFSDGGMPPPPAKWKGKCVFNFTACNNKLIGARYFSRRVDDSPLDENGHGTHVAGTAAGSFVADANFFGEASGTAVGVAPLAHLAVYKACDIHGDCWESDVLAAMDAAIEDGVDILSMSLGFPAVPFAFEAVALGAFSAIQKGIVVSGAADNNGPSYGTLSNEAPWILTVGASTIDRKVVATLLLPNNKKIEGEAFFQPKDFVSNPLPLVYQGFCDSDSLSSYSTNVKGKIVVCEMGGGTTAAAKARTVSNAGGEAIVLINQQIEGLINSLLEAVPLPSTQISSNDGQTMKSYINSTSTPTATLLFKGTVIGDSQAPIVASFSSRGPSRTSPGILKPDIIGPGVNILAAWPFSIEGEINTKSTFNMISGTSMACPHLSGVAALIKSAHPDWSPAAIKSAIMTTADVVNLAHNPILDQTLEAADIFATGAGHVNPSRANDPGLVYDVEPKDYIPYLCGLKYTDQEVTMITQQRIKCSEVSSIAESQLNYPSFSVVFGAQVQRYTRTVTNVGEANSSYVVQISSPAGIDVVVEPKKLDFVELRQKLTYSVTFSSRVMTAANAGVSQGYLTWTSDKYFVRTPIAALFLS